ncbi:NAD-dependent epimerase/dehydratase family protein [Anaerospora hongkongensis]|uniref:NAD-dependent epimerase/dehydratase family protein n=1 Tax=Anaerospora hongkongensis TaxID=244830 RepID=UPI00289E42E2|nr:NAD-dependent epimerase/dehydratase family protein [Anaerospora hongkongensis]
MFEGSSLYQKDVELISNADLPWEQLNNKSVLIVGASGLIGTFLIDVLMLRNQKSKLNLKIYAAGRNKEIAVERFSKYKDSDLFSFVELDVNQPLDLDISFDYILHAASNTHPNAYASDPVGSIMTNLLGTHHLLEYAKRTNIKRFIFLSTVEIYGQAYKPEDTFDEQYCGYIDCNTVRAGYPEGKRAGESLCNAYREKYQIDMVIPRLSRVYGPTMRLDDSKAMSQFILNGVHNEDIILKSEGKQLFSYCYIADAVMGILYVWLKGKSGEAYNIADIDAPMSLREIAECIAKLVGQQVVFDLPDANEQKGFSKVMIGIMDSKKVQALGWKPYDNLKSGITKTIQILKAGN